MHTVSFIHNDIRNMLSKFMEKVSSELLEIRREITEVTQTSAVEIAEIKDIVIILGSVPEEYSLVDHETIAFPKETLQCKWLVPVHFLPRRITAEHG